MMEKMELRPPKLWAMAAGASEFGGGLSRRSVSSTRVGTGSATGCPNASRMWGTDT